MRAFGLLLSLLLAPLAGSAAAAPPCARLTPIDDQRLGYRERGDRCEGIYERDIGTVVEPEFELVSLTVGAIEFAWSETTVLEVRPAAEPGEPVRVRGRAIPRGTQYQMDARIEASSALEWPIRDVLFRVGLRPALLGVVGWLPGREPELLVPLRVGQAGSRPAESTTRAVLQANVECDYIKWRILKLDARGRCVEPGEWHRPEKRSLKLDEQLEIPLPETPARLCLEVTARAKETGGGDLWTELRVIR